MTRVANATVGTIALAVAIAFGYATVLLARSPDPITAFFPLCTAALMGYCAAVIFHAVASTPTPESFRKPHAVPLSRERLGSTERPRNNPTSQIPTLRPSLGDAGTRGRSTLSDHDPAA